MAVIINELEIVLEAESGAPQTNGQAPAPEKPTLSPFDLMAILDREQRNSLRLMAH
jgi:hypothetical protein